MSEYDIVSKEVELAKLRTNDYIMRNAKLASDKANLQKKLRLIILILKQTLV